MKLEYILKKGKVVTDQLARTGKYLISIAIISTALALGQSKAQETADNITLDGQGYNIDGDGGSTDYGVTATGRLNVTIKNLNVTLFWYGIYFIGTNNSLILNNTLSSNVNSGIAISSSSKDNSMINNTIDSNTNGINFLSSFSNTVIGGTISNSDSDAIRMNQAISSNNNFTNINISGTATTGFDIRWNHAGINSTHLIDMQQISNYSFFSVGGTITVKNTNFGEIKFLSAINGSGTNLTNDVRITENLVTVETGNNLGLNRSAEITFFSAVPGTHILRNGEICPSNICNNFTALNAKTVRFNVTSWTNYSLGKIFAQSKVTNNGTLNASIYLLMKVQHYNGGIWEDKAIIYNNSNGQPIKIQPNETLKLDQYWNPNAWNTSNNAPGLYRAYVFAIDKNGNILENSDGSKLISTYNFEIYDITFPPISFVPPTPSSGTQSGNSIYVNVSSSDEYQHYTFVDFDKTNLLWIRMDDKNVTGHPIDLSNYGNNGSLKGNAFINMGGRFREGVILDGDNDYIEIPDTQVFNFTPYNNQITVSAWVKLTSDPNDYRGIVLKGLNDVPEGGGSKGFEIIYRSTVSGFRWMLGNKATGFNYTSIDSGTITPTNWNHIVGTYNGTTAILYVNGIQKASSVKVINNFDTSNSLKIGKFNTGANTRWTNGSIDEILIFNRSLSANEVAALYNASTTQYSNNFTNLATGTHIFKAYAVDLAGNKAETEQRSIIIT